MYFVSNRVKEDAAEKRERGMGRLSKLASLFANYLDGGPNQPALPSSLFLFFFPTLHSCAFSENYLHLFNGSSLENSFAHPIASFLLARFVSIVFDVLCPRFRRVVGAKEPRAKAAENQRRSIPERKKKQGGENGTRGEGKKGKEEGGGKNKK